MSMQDKKIEYISAASIAIFVMLVFIATPSPRIDKQDSNWQNQNSWEETLRKHSNQELDHLISISKQESDKLRAIIQEISQRNDPQLISKLTTLLNHDKDLVKIDIIKLLSHTEHINTKLAHDTLSKLLLDENYLVRGHAAKALAQSNNSQSRLILTNHLPREQHEVVYKLIMRTLAQKA